MNSRDAAARAQDPKLHEAIASYLQTHTRAYDALVTFIKYRRQNQPPEEPLDDEERRLTYNCIRGIIEKQRKVRGNKDWMVSKIQLAYLLRMGGSKLEEFSIACEKQWFLPCQGQPILDSWGPLTRHFFRSYDFYDRAGIEPLFEESDTPIDPTQETISICTGLDNYNCVITGSPLSLVALIVPINWSDTDGKSECTKSLASSLSVIIDNPNGEEPLEHLKALYEHKGPTYKSWNTVCIDRDLYQLWRQGLWAFKWQNAVALPEDPSKSRITLQFHWLYPKDSTEKGKAILKDEDVTLGSGPVLTSGEDIYPNQEGWYISARDHESGRQIESGDICTIIRFTEDIDKCKQTFDIQWEISNAACDSGFTADDDPDEEVEWDLDAEDFPSEDEEWVMAEESECS